MGRSKRRDINITMASEFPVNGICAGLIRSAVSQNTFENGADVVVARMERITAMIAQAYYWREDNEEDP